MQSRTFLELIAQGSVFDYIDTVEMFDTKQIVSQVRKLKRLLDNKIISDVVFEQKQKLNIQNLQI